MAECGKPNCDCEKSFVPSGFHHDYLGRARRSGQIAFYDIAMGQHGIYYAEWSYKTSKRKTSTFFPESWTPDKVMQKIREAHDDPKRIATREDNKWVISGFTSERIKVTIIIEAQCCEDLHTGAKMITAYPEMEIV